MSGPAPSQQQLDLKLPNEQTRMGAVLDYNSGALKAMNAAPI
jgi:hypothetical protein